MLALEFKIANMEQYFLDLFFFGQNPVFFSFYPFFLLKKFFFILSYLTKFQLNFAYFPLFRHLERIILFYLLNFCVFRVVFATVFNFFTALWCIFLFFLLLQMSLPFQDSIIHWVLDPRTEAVWPADADPFVIGIIAAVGRQFVSRFEAM